MHENQRNEKSSRPLVLITGGRGLIGRNLSPVLLSEGYDVALLTRNEGKQGHIKAYTWNPEKGMIDPRAFEGVDYLVHLAGANLGERRWTKKRKEEIISSRSGAAAFLFRVITENKINLQAYITASATGYYGSVTSEKIFEEDDPASDDFLGTTCRLWEEEAGRFEEIGIRTVRIRNAVVLAEKEGVLTRLMNPAKFGFVVRLGSAKQYFPWIHIHDLCGIYLKAIKDQSMQGAYNAVAPEHIDHNDFVRAMARAMRRPVILPPFPGWIIKAALGEMADIILRGSRISSGKIIESGFSFRFKTAGDALGNIITG